MSPDDRRAMRREQIERWISCDMSAYEYCRLNHISKSTFYKWLNFFRGKEPELFGEQKHAGWIEVTRKQAHEARYALAKPGDVETLARVTHAAQAKTAGADTSGASSPIRCVFTSALVEIPSGCAEEDITRVLSVVSSL